MWDTIVIPPDAGIPAAGFLDAIVLDSNDALLLGQNQGGFGVTFDYIGTGHPGLLSFVINDENFNVIFEGRTTDTYTPTNALPEPGALWLLLLAFAGMAVAQSRQTRASTFKSVSNALVPQ